MLRSGRSALTILCARRAAVCLVIVSAVTLGASDTPAPSSVTVAGSLQSELTAFRLPADRAGEVPANGNGTAAVGHLRAFMQQCEDLVASGKLDEADANPLIQEASEIIAQLEAGV